MNKLLREARSFLWPVLDKLSRDREFISEMAGLVEANLLHDVENRRILMNIFRDDIRNPKLKTIIDKTKTIIEESE